MKENKKFLYLASFFVIMCIATMFRVVNDPIYSASTELYSLMHVDRFLTWILFYAVITFLIVFTLSPSKAHSFHFLQSRPYKTDSKLHALVLSFILSFLQPFIQEHFFASRPSFNHTFGIEYFLSLLFSLTMFQIISIYQQPLHHHSPNNLVYKMVTSIWLQNALLAVTVFFEIVVFGISGLYFASAQLFGLALFLPSHLKETVVSTRFEKVVNGDLNRVLSSRLVYLFAGLTLLVAAMGWSVKQAFNNFSINEKDLSSLFWMQTTAYLLSKVPVQVVSYFIHIVDIFRNLISVQQDAHMEIHLNSLPSYIKHLTVVLLHQHPAFLNMFFLWESFACISATVAVCTISTFFPVGLSLFLFPNPVHSSINLNSMAKRAIRRSKMLSEKTVHMNLNCSSLSMNNIGYSQYSTRLKQINISEYNPLSLGDSTMLQQILYFVAPLVFFFCFYKACRACSYLVFVKRKHSDNQVNLSRWIIAYLSIISWSGAVLTSGSMRMKGTYGALTWLSVIASNDKVVTAIFLKSLSVWLLVFLVSIYAPMLSDIVQYFIPRHADDGSNVTIVASHHSENLSKNIIPDEIDLNNGFLGAHHLRLRATNSSNSCWRAKILMNFLYAGVSYCLVKQMMHQYLRTCE